MQIRLNDLDNHDGVVTHLEPDILECEVKWALGSIITNKPSGGEGIPPERFKISKDDTVKMQIWKTQQWPQDWKTAKYQFSFQYKERQCQRMFKLTYSCAHFTC